MSYRIPRAWHPFDITGSMKATIIFSSILSITTITTTKLVLLWFSQKTPKANVRGGAQTRPRLSLAKQAVLGNFALVQPPHCHNSRHGGHARVLISTILNP